MSYQWGPQGPGFEFPTCYRTENRFLTLRAAALIVLALVILWVALSEPDSVSATVAILSTKLQRGSSTPHVLLASLLIVLGVADLWAAARQRRMFLAPGQPASLTFELVRQVKGASAGAAWLTQVLSSGKVPPAEMRGAYRGPLLAVAPHLPGAPNSLQAYLAERLAHLLFGAGLLLALVATWLLVPQAPTLALAALLYGAVAAALVARSAWIAKAAPSPLAVVVALVLAAGLGLGLSLFAGKLPYIGKLALLGLPQATAVLLLCLLLIEGLALLAGRVKADVPPTAALAAAEVKAELATDPERLMQEVERELHRYWTEGIPNRRHAWQTSFTDGKSDSKAENSRFTATVLEETHPVLPGEQRDGIPGPSGSRLVWLLTLQSLGLVLTLAGGVLWVLLADAHMQNPEAPWTSAASAVVLLVAGGYAIRVGHLLWSRIEVESSLLWLECKGAQHPAQGVKLRWSVVRARSVFYAAAEHLLGSRTLLQLTADESAARRSVQQVQAYAERLPATTADERAQAPLFNPARPAAVAAPAAPRLQARFCPSCGTPVLHAARFCQHCGEALRPG